MVYLASCRRPVSLAVGSRSRQPTAERLLLDALDVLDVLDWPEESLLLVPDRGFTLFQNTTCGRPLRRRKHGFPPLAIAARAGVSLVERLTQKVLPLASRDTYHWLTPWRSSGSSVIIRRPLSSIQKG
ncbi:hypothetical protein WME91_08915 [Sorangium sp. So ce269]